MTVHPSFNDPRPAFPAVCPACGAEFDVYHLTQTFTDPDEVRIWRYEGRCERGHLVQPIGEQMRLV